MSKKILVDLDEVLIQFPPAIWGQSDLNEAQAKRLAEKLVKLLVQRCELDVIKFEATVFELPRPMANIIYTPAELKKDEKFDIFAIRKEGK